MRLESQINFSLIIPTRKRVPLLRKCVDSFFSLAKNPFQIEAIILQDFCDLETPSLYSYFNSTNFNIKLLLQRRSNLLITHYHNFGSQVGIGLYTLILNDDAYCVLQNWDEIILNRLNEFLIDKPDRILYSLTNDNIHYQGDHGNFAPPHDKDFTKVNIRTHGTCFPILSKETLDAQNCLMPNELEGWCADNELYKIFEKLKQNRICDITDIKFLQATTVHNKSLNEQDETQSHMNEITKTHELTPSQQKVYIDKLNASII
ncbi:MAG: hypothetical protein AABY22_05055 [Nanoarchaeota archaeon]